MSTAPTPKVTPAEAISIALTAYPHRPTIVDPESDVVTVVIKTIENAGWKIVPREQA